MASMESADPPRQVLDFETTVHLVEEAQRGSREAAEELFARYAPRVREIAAKRLGCPLRDFSRFDDIVQETLLKAFRGLPLFEIRSPGSFQNWITRIVVNAIRDHLRRIEVEKQHNRPLSDEDAESFAKSLIKSGVLTASEILRKKEFWERVKNALLEVNRTNPRYGRVLDLLINRQMEPQEIARELGLPDAKARIAIHRARKMLKGLLGES
jgi:RNA polymerase sigma-70 factor (ECF subfamily)